jgi:hypothetical protein
MSGGSQQQQAPTQTVQNVPSPQQTELMNLALPGVRKFAAQTPVRYPGSQISPFDPSQTAGQEMALEAAPAQQQLATSGANLTNQRLGQDPQSMRDQAIAAVTRPIYQNLTEKALPSIRSDAIGSGGFGGSRQGIAEAQAIRDTGTAAGDAAAKISANIYDTDVKAQLQALGLLPQTQQAALAPATTTSGVGDVRQNMAQQLLGQDVSNFNFDQYAPFLQSQEILSLLQGLPGGSTVATGSVPQQNKLTQALGGAATGAALGSAIMPGAGTLVGGGAGALLPFLFA